MTPINLFPNSMTTTFREVTQDGTKYLIVNGVPIREQVLNYYFVPGDEIAHFIEAWNGVPVTIHHPAQNHGSANVPDPDVQVIGRFYNASWDEENHRMVGEYWIDIAEAGNSDEGKAILNAIRAGRTLETSTGYWADEEPATGVFDNKAYTAIHRNLRPDHIAILPTETGACSLKDGCGVNRNCVITPSEEQAKCPCRAGLSDQPTTNSVKEKVMPPKNKILELLQGLGIKVNEDTMQIVADEPETLAQPQPNPGAPAEPPVTDTPAVPVQAANSAQPQLSANTPQLTINEVNEIRGYISLMTDFGGPDGFKTLLKAMQEVGPVVQNLKANAEAQKTALVAQLHANERCPFSEEELSVMPVEQLTKLNQALSPVNYAGMGAAWQNAGEQMSKVAAPKPALLAMNSEAGGKK